MSSFQNEVECCSGLLSCISAPRYPSYLTPSQFKGPFLGPGVPVTQAGWHVWYVTAVLCEISIWPMSCPFIFFASCVALVQKYINENTSGNDQQTWLSIKQKNRSEACCIGSYSSPAFLKVWGAPHWWESQRPTYARASGPPMPEPAAHRRQQPTNGSGPPGKVPNLPMANPSLLTHTQLKPKSFTDICKNLSYTHIKRSHTHIHTLKN